MRSVKLVKMDISDAQSPIQRVKNVLTRILEDNKPKNGIAVLDGVRAIAILIVVVYHACINSSLRDISWLDPHIYALIYNGYSGVTLFLVLSGFLLFRPYIKSLLFENAWPSVRMFYLRRALRIIPAYYLSLFLIVILDQTEYLQPDHWKQLLLFLTFFMDSAHSTFYHINAPFWTLAVEWQFYMLLPWLALAMRPIVQRGSLKRRIWMLLSCLIGVIIWGVTTRYYGFYLIGRPSKTFGLPPLVFRAIVALLYGSGGYYAIHGKFLEDFGVGMLIAFCYTVVQNTGPEGKWNTILRWLSPWLLIGGIVWLYIMALWGYYLLLPLGNDPFAVLMYGRLWTMFREFGFALGYGSFILAVLFGGPVLKRIFEWTPLRWLGIISFSIYIWHDLILLHLKNAIAPFIRSWNPLQLFGLTLVWVVVIVIPFSFLNFVLIEKPFMRISESLRRPQQRKRKENTLSGKVQRDAAPVPVLVSSLPAEAPKV